jgi:hypothetical protein
MNWYELSCGFLQGFSTSAMFCAYLYAGGDATSFLFWIYLVHFFASFAFHLHPNRLTRFMDIVMINLLVLERGYLKTRNLWIYGLGMASILVEPSPHEIMVMARAAIVCVQGDTTFVYLYLWAFAAMLYLFSCQFQDQGHLNMTTLTCVSYHLLLGVLSALEVPMYRQGITNMTDGFFRYCVYLLFVSYCMVRATKNPKRLRSILSLITAIILSPLSFYYVSKEIYFGYGDEEIHYFMANFYLSYVVVDIVVGMIYYPQYFTLLEGWLHHFGTFSFVYYGYYLNPMKRSRICVQLIVETSSIILFLSRVFYDVVWIRKLKQQLFYPSFFVFRIVLPIFFVIYLHLLCDIYDFLIFVSFTALNLYWLVKMCC